MFKKHLIFRKDQIHRLRKHVLDDLNTAPEDDVLMRMNSTPHNLGTCLQYRINSTDLDITLPIKLCRS
jgi:glucose-6-phosphate-specific signal transduction histidine kinase